MTWSGKWSCLKTTITQFVCTKGYPATHPKRKRVAQHFRQPALRITVGKAIATDCLNCQSPLEWQFAMYTLQINSVIASFFCLSYDTACDSGILPAIPLFDDPYLCLFICSHFADLARLLRLRNLSCTTAFWI